MSNGNDDTPILRTDGITKRFGGLTAVDTVDLTIEEGQIVGLIGPNGAGKSTLFNCITGTLDPDEGHVYLRGRNITDWPEHRIASAGLLRTFQQTQIFTDMNIMNNMLVSVHRPLLGDAFRLPGEDTHERAAGLLDYVGLGELHDVRAGRLSSGQQKLLEFAMALMAEPDILLMDEPAGGINPSMVGKLIDYIRETNIDRAVTILLIEHDMDFVMEIADRIYVLAHGECIAIGTPEEIQTDERVLDAYLGRQ